MTSDKLIKANNLSDKITHQESSLRGIKKTFKELELSEYERTFCKVRLERNECDVKTESLKKFLEEEIKKETKVLESLNKEFDNL